MKITFVSNSIIPSRTANSVGVMKVCQAMAGLGHDVTLLTPAMPWAYEPGVDDPFAFYGAKPNFNIERLAFPRWLKGKFLIYAWACAFFLLRRRPDLVVGRFIYGCFASALLGIPTILDCHSEVWRSGFLARSCFKRLIRLPALKRVTVNSKALKQLCVAANAIEPDKVVVAPNGCDEILDKSLPDGWQPSAALNVGYAGHLYAGRGIDVILQAARRLPDVRFHVMGGSEKDLAFWRGNDLVGANVTFYGHIAPGMLHKYRNACDVMLAPYQDKVTIEGKGDTSSFMCPIKIFEYMASGKAMIASDLPALREVLNDGNSVLVPPSDVTAWVKAIEQLTDPARRMKVATAAYEDFKSKYTWTKRAQTILT